MSIEALFYLLVEIAIIGAVLWIIWWCISQIPMPPPVMVVVRVLFALVVALLAIRWLLPLVGGVGPHGCGRLIC